MRTSFLLLLLCANLFAQDTTVATAAIVAAGYSAPSDFVKAAPGQVISLMVYGLDHRLDSPVVATGTPLPATLAGFSVSLQAGSTTLAAPLLGISQAPCVYPNAGAGLCQSLTIISMQAPFEIYPDCPLCARLTIPAFFVVSDGGVAKAFAVTALPADNIHVVDACDTTAQLAQSGPATCGKIVAHADGTRVDASHPAAVGEELVMYAFGLGRTSPLVKSGAATPNPPPQLPLDEFSLNFDSTPNAPPSFPGPSLRENAAVPAPVYVGLVPGFVGLYQANFIVPATPGSPYVACSGSILSNLTVTLLGPNSYDGAGICVQPQ